MANWSPNFSVLGEIPGVFREAQQRAARERTLANLGQGDFDYNQAARALLSAGDMQGAMTLAQLGRGDRDFEFRRQESQRAQSNADRAFDLQRQQLQGGRVPSGFQPTAGGLQPVPGGPEDPDYLRRKTEATDKGRQMSITDITKLTEEGQKYGDLSRFSETFKPEFAGWGSTTVGNAANVYGRFAPSAVVPESMAQASAWWQGYDRYKNVVRNDLFGSALTKPETEAFERADITPGMNPAQIQKNLAMQKAIVENGLKRKASAMISQGYRPDVIGKAYGIDLGSVGVGGPQAAPQPQQEQPKPQTGITRDTVQAARANPQQALAEARAAIAAGKDRAAVIKRLQQIGIDPSGL